MFANKFWRASWWMFNSGGMSPKRHIAWSNSPRIGLLDTGSLVGWKKGRNAGAETTKSYVDKAGKRCYAGTKHLEETQIPGIDLCSQLAIAPIGKIAIFVFRRT